MIKIDKNLKKVLFMVLDIKKIYIEYFNEANEADK